jgi:hypothetical protein
MASMEDENRVLREEDESRNGNYGEPGETSRHSSSGVLTATPKVG